MGFKYLQYGRQLSICAHPFSCCSKNDALDKTASIFFSLFRQPHVQFELQRSSGDVHTISGVVSVSDLRLCRASSGEH